MKHKLLKVLQSFRKLSKSPWVSKSNLYAYCYLDESMQEKKSTEMHVVKKSETEGLFWNVRTSIERAKISSSEPDQISEILTEELSWSVFK